MISFRAAHKNPEEIMRIKNGETLLLTVHISLSDLYQYPPNTPVRVDHLLRELDGDGFVLPEVPLIRVIAPDERNFYVFRMPARCEIAPMSELAVAAE